ncbi:MAG: hypothetical protein HYX63_01395 [Gammaproteobacteria bacterium]|nr:hypothetical protein [Gammaproteobacteria bacterium]
MNEIKEAIALAIYIGTYKQYGTYDENHWKETSETQRKQCRSQADAVLAVLSTIKINREIHNAYCEGVDRNEPVEIVQRVFRLMIQAMREEG